MMKDRKYIKTIRKRIIVLTAALIIACVSFSVSYSNFVYNSTSHRAVEMYAQSLSYELKINDIYTNDIQVEPGNKFITVSITSNNEVNTKYKLAIDNENINMFYLNKEPFGIIKSYETINIDLFISNNSNKLEKLNFNIMSGYENNSIDSIDIKDNIEITNRLLVGDYIDYNPNSEVEEYNLQGIYTGYKDQIIKRKPSKYRILNINKDGSLDIISETSLTIDKNNNLVTFSGANGYNNAVYLLNDICNTLYGSFDAKARNLNIEDIEEKLSNKWNQTLYNNPQAEFGLKTYEENTYAPISFMQGLKKSEDGNLISENISTKLDSLTINVNYWTHEMEEDNFIDNSYDLFMNQKYNYWLSSRYINAFESYALFGLSSINTNIVGGNLLYSSISNNFTNSNALRPVINLNRPIYLEKGIIKTN